MRYKKLKIIFSYNYEIVFIITFLFQIENIDIFR